MIFKPDLMGQVYRKAADFARNGQYKYNDDNRFKNIDVQLIKRAFSSIMPDAEEHLINFNPIARVEEDLIVNIYELVKNRDFKLNRYAPNKQLFIKIMNYLADGINLQVRSYKHLTSQYPELTKNIEIMEEENGNIDSETCKQEKAITTTVLEVNNTRKIVI